MAVQVFNALLKNPKFGRVYGGPFKEIASNGVTGSDDVKIKMAAEISERCTLAVDTEDFSVPHDIQQVKYALLVSCQALVDGRDVFVGCMGGIGRTGIFLALLTAIARPKEKAPVIFVRTNYNTHAVERPLQHRFVANFVRQNAEFVTVCRAVLKQNEPTRTKRRSRKGAAKNKSAPVVTPLTKVA